VVGLLLAALYNPVWTSAILTPQDLCLAFVALSALMYWKLPAWLVVVGTALAGAVLSSL
jgi:chromate transporter